MLRLKRYQQQLAALFLFDVNNLDIELYKNIIWINNQSAQ